MAITVKPAEEIPDRGRRLLVVVGIVYIAYFIAYLVLYPWFGRSIAVLSAAPVVVTALYFGMQGGALAGVVCVFCNVLLSIFAQPDLSPWQFRLINVPGNLAVLAAGAVVGYLRDIQVRLAHEIGERRAMERGARDAEQRLRSILDNSPIIILLTDREGRISFANRTLTPTGGDLVGHNMFEFVVEEDRPIMRQYFERASKAGETAECEVRVHRAAGGVGVFRTHLGPVFENGEVDAVVAAGVDISGLKELEALRSKFVEKVVAAQEEERRRISRELHDVAAQSLTSLLIGLRVTGELPDEATRRKRLEELRTLASQTLDDLNRLAHGLHPSVLDDVGLAAALERYCVELRETHGLEADLEIIGFGIGARLPGSVEITLYRIIQEALINITKHADASRASVVVERKADTVRAIIEDDGRGFALNETTGMPHISNGLGLLGIRERADLVGGTVTIESAEGTGTTLFVTLPTAPSAVGIRAP